MKLVLLSACFVSHAISFPEELRDTLIEQQTANSLYRTDPGHDLQRQITSSTLFTKPRLKRQIPTLPNVTREDINAAIAQATEAIDRRFNILEPQLFKNGN
jgi:hypothetical protein